MDRCALFVDAGYVLADGAMAVHGTSIRESVSWDYAGLLQFLSNLSTDRTGQQLLRCYWYEAAADGRRSPEHDTLADLPGLMLRLGRMRPGKREGVETEIHRDLTTLARNRAVSDVLLVSAEEDLAQVIADVQDLGVRVIIVHISVDGNWTVSRSLRQQCDDIVEIDATQLRPYVELIAGAEPSRYSEQYTAGGYGGKPMSNGHSAAVGGSGGHAALASGSTGAHPAPPAIYTAPVVADYQPSVQPAADYQPSVQPAADYQPSVQPAADHHPPAQPAPGYQAPAQQAAGYHPPAQPAADYQPPAQPPAPAQADPVDRNSGEQATGRGTHRGHPPGNQSPAGQSSGPQRGQSPGPRGGQSPSPQRAQPAPPLYATQGPDMFREPTDSAPGAQARNAVPQGASSSGPALAPPTSAPRANGGSPPYAPSHQGGYTEQAASQFSPAPPEQFSSAPPSLPARLAPQQNGMPGNGNVAQRGPQTPRSQPGPRSHQAPRSVAAPGAGYVPQQSGYAQLPAGSSAGAASPGGSMADTVQAAHSEGFDFGESVARDAPALWLEAVLARKPRMPSDLEARLLQGSALPIDSLLHDEVRQALRRGFWDALERSRR